MRVQSSIIYFATALLLSHTIAQAATNPNTATHGQWRDASGQVLSVGADGVKSYAFSEDECRAMGQFSHKAIQVSGSNLQSELKSTLDYHGDLLKSSKLDAEAAKDVRDNIRTIQKALPMIQARQNYAGIEHDCGDQANRLIFLQANTAIESTFVGGETFYHLYRK